MDGNIALSFGCLHDSLILSSFNIQVSTSFFVRGARVPIAVHANHLYVNRLYAKHFRSLPISVHSSECKSLFGHRLISVVFL